MNRKYSILVVEDEPLIAEDIAGYLEESGFSVSGIANDGNQALQLLKQARTDAVLLDINLGTAQDGIELAGIIRQQYNLPFVFLTSHGDKATLERAKTTFPAGYLLKPFDGFDLMTSLEVALYNHFNQQQQNSNGINLNDLNKKIPTPLSQREFELMQLLQTGKTNREIGEALFISVNTVKTHLQNLFEKLDAHNRTQAMFRIRELSET